MCTCHFYDILILVLQASLLHVVHVCVYMCVFYYGRCSCVFYFVRYTWHSTRWGECRVPSNSSNRCGSGSQSRQVYCIEAGDRQLRPVDQRLCSIGQCLFYVHTLNTCCACVYLCYFMCCIKTGGMKYKQSVRFLRTQPAKV